MMMLMTFSSITMSQVKVLNQLGEDDQKYFKNGPGEGRNRIERMDLTVKEINKLHAEIAALKSEIASLKSDVENLKNQAKQK